MSLTLEHPPGDGGHQPVAESYHLRLKPYPYIFSLDVLRGMAVTAALLTGIWAFGGFSTNQQAGLLLTNKGWNHPLLVLVSGFFEGKMGAIISLVFGAGMILFLSKERTTTLTVPDLFIRRQLWLIIFGLVNGLILLNTNDVLFHLGIFGIILFPFVRFSFRSLLIAAILVTFIYSAKNAWNFSDHGTAYHKYLVVTSLEKKNVGKKGDTLAISKQQKDDKAAWEGILATFKYDPKKDDGDNKARRSTSYARVWNQMVPELQKRESQWTYSYGIWDFTGLILLGMAVFKSGFFNSKLSTRLYIVLAVAGMIAGILCAWFRLHFHHLAIVDYVKYLDQQSFPFDIIFPFERIFMCLGYCSIVMLAIRVNSLTFIWNAFAAAGRMSLTNYLLQGIFCALFFTGFGMGYYGMLKQYQLYFVAAEICLVQMVFSICWLRYYQAGPAEWLLRCLVHRKMLSNKKVNTPLPEEAVASLY